MLEVSSLSKEISLDKFNALSFADFKEDFEGRCPESLTARGEVLMGIVDVVFN